MDDIEESCFSWCHAYFGEDLGSDTLLLSVGRSGSGASLFGRRTILVGQGKKV
jgi:hypothetical protein